MPLVETMRARMEALIRRQQATICRALEELDGTRFRCDEWTRADGGGGTSRVVQDGNVFEKAGVNIAVVHGPVTAEMVRVLLGSEDERGAVPQRFFAASLSVVIHPQNPFAPTAHANYRYFELDDDAAPGSWWFGGGADLTPSYVFEDDARHFHQAYKHACDRHDPTLYPRFKARCDEYFFLPHRGERRGIGGIFFDQFHGPSREAAYALVQSCAETFLPAYLPIVERRKDLPFSAAQKRWQQIRRGRYIEFNLLYDRGTSFGFKTGGRPESILMSLPLLARWEYDQQPEPGSEEARTLEVLRHPREWL